MHAKMPEDFIRVAIVQRIPRRRPAGLRRKQILGATLLLMLLLIITIAFAQSQIRLFTLRTSSNSYENGEITPSNFNTGEQDEGNGITNQNFIGSQILGQTVNDITPLGMWASDAAGFEKHVFIPTEAVCITVSASSETVTLYVTEHKEEWSDCDVLTDVSGGTEELILTPDCPKTGEIWNPILIPGCYDVVLDENNNGVFDLGTDLTDKIVVGPLNVVPEVPLGVVTVSLSMFAAAAVFAGFKRFQAKRY